MLLRRETARPARASDRSLKRDEKKEAPKAEPKRRRRWGRVFLFGLALLIVAGVISRALLPGFVRDYVNRTLDRNPLYEGRIGDVRIHLWRGAYSIEEVRINKTSGNVPVPLFSAKRVDFAIQWDALLHGEVVGRMLMEEPELNFVDGEGGTEDQTGAGAPWLKIIKELFPFRINRAIVRNGSVHFRAYKGETPVDVYLSQVEGWVDNLTNIRDETKQLVSTVQATGLAMDHAKLEYKMTLDPFAYRPTFHMAVRLLGLDVTQLNDLAKAYGKFDFEHGWFDLVIETDAKEGQISGYVKPLFRDLKVFSLSEDFKDDNPLLGFWQALVGGVTSLLKNHPRDQFGTLIPFEADAGGATNADILATLGNVLRNAFIRAYLPRLEDGQETLNGLQFKPPELHDPISASESL